MYILTLRCLRNLCLRLVFSIAGVCCAFAGSLPGYSCSYSVPLCISAQNHVISRTSSTNEDVLPQALMKKCSVRKCTFYWLYVPFPGLKEREKAWRSRQVHSTAWEKSRNLASSWDQTLFFLVSQM